jgi:hypothetical protein
MESFHRHLWQGMWENKDVYGNVYRNFPDIFIFRLSFLKIKMSMQNSH